MAWLGGAVVALVVVWLVSCAHRLYTNYRNALLTGFPIVICPVNPQNVLFLLSNVPLQPFYRRVLPAAVYARLRLCTFGWAFKDKHAFHDATGPVFVLVTTGVNELWVSDPALGQVALARRKDFVTVHVTKLVMGLLGNNMVSSDGETWARQRRLIAPNLNERISALVWAEGMSQAGQMADYLGTDGGNSNSNTPDVTPRSAQTVASLRAIAFNVLGQVGYGQPKAFRPLQLPRDPKAPMAYVDALSLVTQLLAVAAFVPARLLVLPFMPRLVQTLGAALQRLPGLTAEMLEVERKRLREVSERREEKESEERKSERSEEDMKSESRDTIMTVLAKLSNKERTAKAEATSESGYLLEEEVAGNLFLVTGAGFDTTANTLSYAAVLLAAYPEKQAWLRAEVDSVFGAVATPEQLDYATDYPKLVRCLAFMFETLRIFPAVIYVARTSPTDQSITANNKTYPLVGCYDIYVNSASLHTMPSLWGADSDEFRPERWIERTADGKEELITPAKGTFLPWSSGPRVCPGQKMSQVEFVVVIATLLWRCHVRPVVLAGETMADACRRLLLVADDSQPRLTLQMNRPEDVLLTWEKRR